MKKILLAISAVLLAAPLASQAQAPAGSTGQCKDGSYTSVATKSGACRGHQGIQTWFAATAASTSKSAASAKPAPAPAATKAAPAAAPAMAPAAKPAPTAAPAPAMAAKPAPAAAPATATAKGSKPAKVAAPGGGPGLVWVNTSSKVYHCPGTEDYGTTKAGKYMSEKDALGMGAHADHGKACSAK